MVSCAVYLGIAGYWNQEAVCYESPLPLTHVPSPYVICVVCLLNLSIWSNVGEFSWDVGICCKDDALSYVLLDFPVLIIECWILLWLSTEVNPPVVWIFLGKTSNFHSPLKTPVTGEKTYSLKSWWTSELSWSYLIGTWVNIKQLHNWGECLSARCL